MKLEGPRQAGKSTLARAWVDAQPGGRYLTLDDPAVLAAAAADPAAFIEALAGPTVIDEIQRAPGLFLAIKAAVDRDRRPGRFLLTGSADVLLLPGLADSLAGRMEVQVLWPLSQGELLGQREGFIDALFADASPVLAPSELDRDALLARMLAGGFPDAVAREAPARRAAWFDAYLTTLLQRDVRDLANVDRLRDMPRLFQLTAARMASLANHAELARAIDLPQTTLKRYLALLELVFLVRALPAWSGNLSKRLVKAPKLLVCDGGLAAHAIGATPERLAREPDLVGPLLENFVATELLKQLPQAAVRARPYHYRSQTGIEVDLVLEAADGRLVGIEVKARRSVEARDFRGLRDLQAGVPDRFRRGVVLYTGPEPVAFGDQLLALPVDALWRLGAA